MLTTALLVITLVAPAQTVRDVPSDYPTIQSAVDASLDGDSIAVAPGVYAETVDLSGRAITLEGPGATIDGGGVRVCVIAVESASRVVGLTIANGYAEYGGGAYVLGGAPAFEGVTFTGNEAHVRGGGMYSEAADTALVGCTFTANAVPQKGGGGIFFASGGAPTVTACTFVANHAAFGGAVRNWHADPVCADCTFIDNTANLGGAMRNLDAHPLVVGCIFTGNTAMHGGAVENYTSSPTFTGCWFEGNQAGHLGGAVHNATGSAPVVTGCLFVGNTAASGAAIQSDNGSLPAVGACSFRQDASGAIVGPWANQGRNRWLGGAGGIRPHVRAIRR